MKPPKTALTHNPFRNLKILLEARAISLPDGRVFELGEPDAYESHATETEEELFQKAMKDVIPIARESWGDKIFQISKREVPARGVREKEGDEEALAKLRELVNSGAGFHIYDTPEYVEGTGYRIHPELAKRLHRGDFSIQAHLDLHGLSAHDARISFENFLREAVHTGKSGILVIHGRGLSSPSVPVLKTKVIEWLTRGSWRKWVIAYATARSCDGGAGATYVLLRKHPVSRTAARRKK